MIFLDVNVLVYAYQLREPGHESYRSWLQDALRRHEPLAVSEVTPQP